MAPVLAARLLRRRPPVILHEQNAVLGRANRLLARHADVLALSFAGTGARAGRRRATASPAIRCVRGSPRWPARPTRRRTRQVRLLVLGGSLGARVFSDVVPAALAVLPDALRARLSVVQQCRAEDLERVRAAYAAAASRRSWRRSSPTCRRGWQRRIW